MLVGTSRRSVRGITLIELMITVAIVGILAAIAYPSYRQYVLRGNRTEAKAAMMQAAQNMEKCFTRLGVYNDDVNCAEYARLNVAANLGPTTETGKYRLSVVATATTFDLQAVPQAGQTADTRCGTLTLDETNQRGSLVTGAPADCW